MTSPMRTLASAGRWCASTDPEHPWEGCGRECARCTLGILACMLTGEMSALHLGRAGALVGRCRAWSPQPHSRTPCTFSCLTSLLTRGRARSSGLQTGAHVGGDETSIRLVCESGLPPGAARDSRAARDETHRTRRACACRIERAPPCVLHLLLSTIANCVRAKVCI